MPWAAVLPAPLLGPWLSEARPGEALFAWIRRAPIRGKSASIQDNHTYAYAYIYIYLFIYLFIERERAREREREREREGETVYGTVELGLVSDSLN